MLSVYQKCMMSLDKERGRQGNGDKEYNNIESNKTS